MWSKKVRIAEEKKKKKEKKKEKLKKFSSPR